MATTLEAAIKGAYSNYTPYNYSYNRRQASFVAPRKYLIVPVGEVFELPTFFLSKFSVAVPRGFNNYATVLYSKGLGPDYKSVGVCIKNAFNNRETEHTGMRCLKLEDCPTPFYVKKGAIFDHDYVPLVMCTWQLRMGKDTRILTSEAPICRISPECWTMNNSLSRFITGKMLRTLLGITVCSPNFFTSSKRYYDIRVLVEKIPFQTRKTKAPDATTTNEELIRVALDNVDAYNNVYI